MAKLLKGSLSGIDCDTDIITQFSINVAYGQIVHVTLSEDPLHPIHVILREDPLHPAM